MSQKLYESFEADTVGSAPPNTNSAAGTWKVGTTHPTTGSNDLEDATASPTDGSLIFWTTPSAPANQAIQADFTIVNKATNNYVNPQLVGRSSGDLTTSSFYVLNLSPQAGTTGLYYWNGSTFTAITTPQTNVTTPVFTNGAKITLKLDINGTTIAFKVWTQGTTEPATFTGSWTDSNLSSGAFYGIRTGVTNTGGSPLSSPDNFIDNFYMGDTGQAFSPWATSYTLTGPASGYAGIASTNFSLTPNGPVQSLETFTLSDGSVGGTFTPSSPTIAAGSSTPATFTYTPPVGHDGNITISVTSSPALTNPSNVTYDSLVPLVSCSPTFKPQNQTGATLALTGTGTTWSTNAPSWAVSGLSGTSITGHTVTNNTSMTLTINTGGPTGFATFTNSVDNSSFKLYVGTTTTLAKTVQFGPTYAGLAGTVGYTLYNTDGSTFQARTTTGISELNTGVSGSYIVAPTVPLGLSFGILWDTGGATPQYASDEINPAYLSPQGFDGINVEPNAGINPRQALSILAAAIGGKLTGNGTGTVTIYAANDNTTVRIVVTNDVNNNRTTMALTLPP